MIFPKGWEGVPLSWAHHCSSTRTNQACGCISHLGCITKYHNFTSIKQHTFTTSVSTDQESCAGELTPILMVWRLK